MLKENTIAGEQAPIFTWNFEEGKSHRVKENACEPSNLKVKGKKKCQI